MFFLSSMCVNIHHCYTPNSIIFFNITSESVSTNGLTRSLRYRRRRRLVGPELILELEAGPPVVAPRTGTELRVRVLLAGMTRTRIISATEPPSGQARLFLRRASVSVPSRKGDGP